MFLAVLQASLVLLFGRYKIFDKQLANLLYNSLFRVFLMYLVWFVIWNVPFIGVARVTLLVNLFILVAEFWQGPDWFQVLVQLDMLIGWHNFRNEFEELLKLGVFLTGCFPEKNLLLHAEDAILVGRHLVTESSPLCQRHTSLPCSCELGSKALILDQEVIDVLLLADLVFFFNRLNFLPPSLNL